MVGFYHYHPEDEIDINFYDMGLTKKWIPGDIYVLRLLCFPIISRTFFCGLLFWFYAARWSICACIFLKLCAIETNPISALTFPLPLK